MKYSIFRCTLLVCLFTPSVFASEVSSGEIQALREQIRLLSERLDQLEQQSQTASDPSQQASPVQETTTPSVAAASPAQSAAADEDLNRRINQAVDAKVSERMANASWAERLRWSGDFRYRYENVSIENQDDRSRNRIRARARLTADVSDSIQVGLGLATGGDDPVSTNQTLGGGGSSKPISLDLAYVEWTGLNNTHVLGGIFEQQHHRAGDFGLIWDSDWRPEGTSVRYDNGKFFAVGLGSWMESDSNTSQQEFAYGLQAGMNFSINQRLRMSLGAGYYEFDTRGKSSFFGDEDFFGNSFDPLTGTYVFDYHEIEGFAELEFELFDRKTILFADYVENLDADQNDSGYAFGVNYGQAKRPGSWEVNYAYKKLEADAVLGLLADSDFGNGGTDAKGSVFSGAYAVHDNWNFRMTYFLNETDIASEDPQDLERLQLDLQFKFK
jgi:hypothetical protein